ncbi:MAG: carboxynorspermidine decarboxylase [Lachnospiraceae bacterium]|nr:carboxynorspermidine decarboxylase [Lachnospiraceae bacterium]
MNFDKYLSQNGSLPEPFRGLIGRDLSVFDTLSTPCFILDEARLKANANIIREVSERSGAEFLLAQKAFSCFDVYELFRDAAVGTEASGLYEARLGGEEMPSREVHVYCGAYREEQFEELLRYADHIVFNSIHELARFGRRAKDAGLSVGLRINPECSTQEGHAIYDPCAPGSRMGVTRGVWEKEMTPELFELLDGIHFHTLCEQNSDDLETTLKAVESLFGPELDQMKWINFGGGHHVTRSDYDRDRLIHLVKETKAKYPGIRVYLEPGEAWALNAGYYLTHVLDLVENGSVTTAIVDGSACCHMPDVLEMPYTPPLLGAVPSDRERREYVFRLAGPTCLAGDVIGEYSFEEELQEGDLLVFGDMAIYSIVKTNTFNGMPLPSVYLWREDGSMECLASFGYEDFKRRLGGKV